MKIEDLKDIYKGKPVFCVGSGPSLHFIEKELLKIKDYPIICANSAILKFADLGCKNLYFLSDDIAVKNWNYFQELKKINCTYLLFEDKLKNHVSHLDKNKIVWFKHKCWYSPFENKHYPEGLVLTKNEPIIGSRTSLGSAIHIAYIMGGIPVLLGSDCCYYQNKRYFWQFEGEKKAYRLDGKHSINYPNKGIKDGFPVDDHSLSFIEYWEALSKQLKKQNINVINCSGGILKCFNRMGLKEVLEKYR
jgi:hypothetical protein